MNLNLALPTGDPMFVLGKRKRFGLTYVMKLLVNTNLLKMKKQDKNLDFNGQKVFVAMDVHKRTWKVATCTANTNPTNWPVTIKRPFVENVKKYLDTHFPGADFECTYEAGFSGFWIQKKLSEIGIQTIVAHAADVPTTDKERQQKEDRRDARKLAKALKNGAIRAIHVPSDQALKERSLVRERYSIAKNGRRIKCQIKSHLALYNIEIPEDMTKKHWSGIFIKWLEKEQVALKDETLRLQLSRLYLIRKLQLQANRMVRKIAVSKKNKEVYQILLSVPGIGPLTAVLLIAELIDMERFANFNQLCSYVGFIPTTKSSGDKEGKGSLTKRCNTRIKAALVESSWAAIKSDRELLLKYEELKKRMTGQEAIVRIARILLSRIRSVWKSGQKYKRGQE